MKRKKLHSILLANLICTLFLSCSTTAQQKEIKEINLWKSDSLGCQKIRTKAMSEKIIDSMKLEKVSQSDFVICFGNPNTRTERGGDIILGYYFDALCRSEKFIDSADYCIAEYTFREHKLTQRNYICQ